MPKLSKDAFGKLLQQKKGFLVAVYATLIAELLITFGIIYGFRNNETLSKTTRVSFWIYFVLSLGLILILSLIDMPVWLKLMLFTLFSVVSGAMLHYASHALPRELINRAVLGAIGVFVGMTVLAIVLAYLGVDLGFLGLFLLAGLIGLLVGSLILLITGGRRDENNKMTAMYKFILVLGLILFSIYIMYFTNIMLQRNYGQDFVSAAIDLYLGFINIFTKLLVLENE
jgi:FtsH-binding integral membrane protein